MLMVYYIQMLFILTILTDSDGADLPRVEPRIRVKLDDEEVAASIVQKKHLCCELNFVT